MHTPWVSAAPHRLPPRAVRFALGETIRPRSHLGVFRCRDSAPEDDGESAVSLGFAINFSFIIVIAIAIIAVDLSRTLLPNIVVPRILALILALGIGDSFDQEPTLNLCCRE